VAQGAGIDTHFNGGHYIPLSSVLQYLPIVRSYQPVDVLGHNFYKLQCYFITHFIYVFSDWGHHRLRRELFAEEFNFIVANLHMVIRLKDSEIVGEFLQCLCILQFTPETDPELVPIFEAGKKFLIRAEAKQGNCGLWRTHNAPLEERLTVSARIYDKYHSSYCASVGLIDYAFAGDTAKVFSLSIDSSSGTVEVVPSTFAKLPEAMYESLEDQQSKLLEQVEPPSAPVVKVVKETPVDPDRSKC
jgi:hypothetical protein